MDLAASEDYSNNRKVLMSVKEYLHNSKFENKTVEKLSGHYRSPPDTIVAVLSNRLNKRTERKKVTGNITVQTNPVLPHMRSVRFFSGSPIFP